jgi:hypothetical protein
MPLPAFFQSFRPSHSQHRRLRSRRWIVVLIASVLLHVVAFDWIDGSITLPSWHTAPDRVVMAELRPEPAPMPPPVAPVEPVASPKRAKPRRHKPATAATQPPLEHSAPTLAAESPVGDAVPGTSVEAPAEVTGQPVEAVRDTAPAAEAPQAETSAATPYKFSAPPSAELQYDVEAQRDNQAWHGTGSFRWDAAGTDYSVTAEASIRLIFKITVLNSRSEGKLNDFGIAPVLYSEKPFRKSLTNTHFQHDSHRITFSASEASYPYVGGEQDRASVLFQLAGIGLANPEQFKPGAQLAIVVAGPRDAEPWQIQVLGEEEAELPSGKVRVWHVLRAPRPGSYDSRIDIWLAPDKNWYPVRIRYTYVNADYLDMSLSNIAEASR